MKSFFSHSLDPIPESEPPFFVRLFEEQNAGVWEKESSDWYGEFVQLCRQHYRNQLGDHSKAPHGYHYNEALQGLLDTPLQAFTVGEGWEKRKTAIRNFTGTFMQKAVTVCQANMLYANCAAAVGFTRRGVTGSIYFNDKEGLYYQGWKSPSQARMTISILKYLWQKVFELQLRTIRIPATSFFMYQAQLFSVSAVIPLLPDAQDSIPEVDKSALLAHEAALLEDSLGIGRGKLRLSRAGDGRCYIVDIHSLYPFLLPTATVDQNPCVRPEAIHLLPPGARISATATSADLQASKALIKATLLEQLVPEAARALLKAVETRNCNIQVCTKDNIVAKTLHKKGVNLRFLYAVMEELDKQQLGFLASSGEDEVELEESTVFGSDLGSTNPPGLISPTGSTSGRQSFDVVRGVALELVQNEMILRTVKEMIRVELRASIGEDEAAHAQRVNRLMSTLPSKKADAWGQQLHPILRAKFAAPLSFVVPISSNLIKTITAFLTTKLGFGFDRNSMRFTTFIAQHLATTVFSPPEELVSTVTNLTQPIAVAKSETSSNDRDSFSNSFSSPHLRRAESSFYLPSAALTKDKDSSGGGGGGGAGRSERSDSVTGTVQVASRKQMLSEKLSAEWNQILSSLRDKKIAGQAPTECGATDLPYYHPSLHQAIRILVIEKILVLPSFERHRQQLDSTLFSEFDAKSIAHESVAHPPVSKYNIISAAVRLHLMNLEDSLSTVQRSAFDTHLKIVCNNNANAEDAVPIGCMYIQSGKAGTEPLTVMTGLRLMRYCLWADHGLAPQYFDGCIAAVAYLNVRSNTFDMKEALRNATRTANRQNPTSRRAALLQTLRRISAALINSQEETLCGAMRYHVKDSFTLHTEKFGTRHPQTGVAHAQCVYTFVTSYLSRLNPTQQRELKKFHYHVAAMGSSTVEALEALLASEGYLSTLSQMLIILESVGEVVVAEKLIAHTYAQDTEDIPPVLKKALNTLQNGAATQLQKVFRSVVQKVGGSEQIEHKRLHRCDHAYRAGLEWVEREEREYLVRYYLESYSLAIRAEIERREVEELKTISPEEIQRQALLFKLDLMLKQTVVDADDGIIDLASEEKEERKGHWVSFKAELRQVWIQAHWKRLNDIHRLVVRTEFHCEETDKRLELERTELDARESELRCLYQLGQEWDFDELVHRNWIHTEEIRGTIFFFSWVAVHREEEAARKRIVQDEHFGAVILSGGVAMLQRVHAVNCAEDEARLWVELEEDECWERLALEIGSNATRVAVWDQLQFLKAEEAAREEFVSYHEDVYAALLEKLMFLKGAAFLDWLDLGYREKISIRENHYRHQVIEQLTLQLTNARERDAIYKEELSVRLFHLSETYIRLHEDYIPRLLFDFEQELAFIRLALDELLDRRRAVSTAFMTTLADYIPRLTVDHAQTILRESVIDEELVEWRQTVSAVYLREFEETHAKAAIEAVDLTGRARMMSDQQLDFRRGVSELFESLQADLSAKLLLETEHFLEQEKLKDQERQVRTATYQWILLQRTERGFTMGFLEHSSFVAKIDVHRAEIIARQKLVEESARQTLIAVAHREQYQFTKILHRHARAMLSFRAFHEKVELIADEGFQWKELLARHEVGFDEGLARFRAWVDMDEFFHPPRLRDPIQTQIVDEETRKRALIKEEWYKAMVKWRELATKEMKFVITKQQRRIEREQFIERKIETSKRKRETAENTRAASSLCEAIKWSLEDVEFQQKLTLKEKVWSSEQQAKELARIQKEELEREREEQRLLEERLMNEARERRAIEMANLRNQVREARAHQQEAIAKRKEQLAAHANQQKETSQKKGSREPLYTPPPKGESKVQTLKEERQRARSELDHRKMERTESTASVAKRQKELLQACLFLQQLDREEEQAQRRANDLVGDVAKSAVLDALKANEAELIATEAMEYRRHLEEDLAIAEVQEDDARQDSLAARRIRSQLRQAIQMKQKSIQSMQVLQQRMEFKEMQLDGAIKRAVEQEERRVRSIEKDQSEALRRAARDRYWAMEKARTTLQLDVLFQDSNEVLLKNISSLHENSPLRKRAISESRETSSIRNDPVQDDQPVADEDNGGTRPMTPKTSPSP
jgi:hypothetical protein